MYLRFRNSQLSLAKSDNAFEELYRQIHGRLPEQVRPNNKPNFTVQIYLVKNQRINKKPTQIYIGVLANAKIYIGENKKIFLENNFWEDVRARLNSFNLAPKSQDSLVNKIEDHLFNFTIP